MAIAELYTNSQSISTTEYSLPLAAAGSSTITTDGIFQWLINFSGMLAGDSYEVKLKEKVTSGGSQVILGTWTLTGVQPGPLVLPSLILLHGWDVTVKRLAGSDRTIAWSCRQVA